MKHTAQRPKRLPLVAAIAAVGLMGSIPAQAFQFDVTDEIKGSFDTTLTYGALWRVAAPDSKNIGRGNGGDRNSSNYDNGNLNYDRGEMVQSLFKMNNDIDISYGNFGAFARVLSFYDDRIQNKEFDPLTTDDRVVKNRLGHDYEIYDAYVRGSFDVLDRSLNIRAGKQVVSWGESTFLPNGINTLNPVDVAKLRAPGSELKEAFLPIGMVQATYDFTDNLSLELVHQYQFRATRIEPNGSYFSTNDFVSPGGSKVLIAAALASEDPTTPAPRGTFIPRSQGKDHSGSRQFGLATRLLVPELNNTEFGFYFANYHNRTPLVSGRTTSLTAAQEGAIQAAAIAGLPAGATPAQQQAAASGATTVARARTSSYFAEYPDDVRMFGLSFNTLGPLGIALQGEYSYRPNQPLQLGANNLLGELLSLGASPANTGVSSLPRDTAVEGYRRVKTHQLQLTATQTLGRFFGADQIIGVAEMGYVYLDLPNGIDFNGTGLDSTTTPTTSAKGIATRNSYGYRALVRGIYNNAIGAIGLSPRIAFSHDVRGTSATFSQNAQAVSVGVGANYQNNWQADLAYTNFFGGDDLIIPGPDGLKSSNQPLSDRDFISASVSYAF